MALPSCDEDPRLRRTTKAVVRLQVFMDVLIIDNDMLKDVSVDALTDALVKQAKNRIISHFKEYDDTQVISFEEAQSVTLLLK